MPDLEPKLQAQPQPQPQQQVLPQAGAPATAAAGTLKAAGQKPFEEGRAELSPEEKKKKEEERSAAARAEWEGTLGTWLGDRTYQIVHKELSPEKVLKIGDQGADALIKFLVGELEKQGGKLDGSAPGTTDALAKLLPELQKWAEEAATEYLESDSGKGLAEKISHWAEAHPKTVVAIALLAAAGAIAANVKIPELKYKKDLGNGLSAEAGVKLGKVRDLALESVRAALTYEKGQLKADVSVKHDRPKDGPSVTTVSAGVAVGEKGAKGEVRGEGEYKDNGDFVIGLKAGGEYGPASGSFGQKWTQVAGKSTAETDVNLKVGDEKRELTTEGRFTGDNTYTLKLAGRSELTNGYSVGGEATRSRDASGAERTAGFVGLGYSAREGNLSYDRRVGMANDRLATTHDVTIGGHGPLTGNVKATEFAGSRDTEGSLGLKYSFGTLAATLDGKFGKSGNTLDAGVSGKVGGADSKWSYSGGLGLDLDRSELVRASLMFGYRDPKAFEAALLEYKHEKANGVSSDTFRLTVEHTVRDFLVRGSADATLTDGRFSRGSAELMAMKPINDNFGIIGGVATQMGPDRTGGTEARLGVQWNKIPVYVKYDFENKAVGVGISIPFGR
jgi:hypothetical protein